jgi:hypothetical protein
MRNDKTLQEKVHLLERRLTLLTFSFMLLLGYLVCSRIVDVRAQTAPGKLVLRRLAIVDEKGVERVLIAAPAPDPIVGGKRFKRNGAVSGMLIYDRDGNERGGYVTANGDTNGAMLTLDGVDKQVFTVYANPANGATLSLNNQKGDDITITTWNRPVIQMMQARKVFYKYPPDAPEVR